MRIEIILGSVRNSKEIFNFEYLLFCKALECGFFESFNQTGQENTRVTPGLIRSTERTFRRHGADPVVSCNSSLNSTTEHLQLIPTEPTQFLFYKS